MKTIVVISDTHGHRAGIEKLKPLFAENDYIIHLGDGASDMRDIVNAYPEKTFVCQGNCDFFSALPEGELEVEGVKIFFCHGHKYRVRPICPLWRRKPRAAAVKRPCTDIRTEL